MKEKRLHHFRTLDDYLDSMEESRSAIFGYDVGPTICSEQCYLLAVVKGTQDNANYDSVRTQLYQLYDNNRKEFTFEEISKRLGAQSMRAGGREETPPEQTRRQPMTGEKVNIKPRKTTTKIG